MGATLKIFEIFPRLVRESLGFILFPYNRDFTEFDL